MYQPPHTDGPQDKVPSTSLEHLCVSFHQDGFIRPRFQQQLCESLECLNVTSSLLLGAASPSATRRLCWNRPQCAAYFLFFLTATLSLRPVGIAALVNILLQCCLTAPLWLLRLVLKHREDAKRVYRMLRQTGRIRSKWLPDEWSDHKCTIRTAATTQQLVLEDR